MSKIVAIDFELANHHYLSACALGIVVLDEGVIVFEEGFLIKPPTQHNVFIPEFIAIHKIQPEDVEYALSFDQVYEKIKFHLNDATLIAHNAPFDMSILRELSRYYQCPLPNLNYACTVLLSRKLFSSLSNHKLNTVASYLQIDLDHHQAHSDAKACMHIAAYGMSMYQVESVETLCLKMNVKIKRLFD
jgi:DNA polymerase-3 subunit epsilon